MCHDISTKYYIFIIVSAMLTADYLVRVTMVQGHVSSTITVMTVLLNAFTLRACSSL